MNEISDLDDLIADNVREFELGRRRQHKLDEAEREKFLSETLGPPLSPSLDEKFVIGDSAMRA